MRGSLSARPIDPEQITIKRLAQILDGVTIVGDCWVHKNRHHTGYTFATLKQIKYPIHRIILTVAYGKVIERSLVTDHLCKNKSCVNPAHLELVSQSENIRRGTAWHHLKRKNDAITHCPQGHPYNIENTYRWNNVRQCRICRENRRTIARR